MPPLLLLPNSRNHEGFIVGPDADLKDTPCGCVADYPLTARLPWQRFDLSFQGEFYVWFVNPALTESVFRMARISQCGQDFPTHEGR